MLKEICYEEICKKGTFPLRTFIVLGLMVAVIIVAAIDANSVVTGFKNSSFPFFPE